MSQTNHENLMSADIPESCEVHPTAILNKGCCIGDNVKVGAYSIIGPEVTLKAGVNIHAHVVIDGYTTIGDNTEIFPFASIGSPTQDKKFTGGRPQLIIGSENIIREHVTMNPSTEPDGKTIVGNNGLFMVGSHIAHDCLIGDNVIMANNATLAGHVELSDYVIIGGLSAIHQFIRIGYGAIIGGMSGVESDVIPFGRVKGDRAYLAGLNIIGMERQGIEKSAIRELQKAYSELFEYNDTIRSRIDKVEKLYQDNEIVQSIIEFARKDSKFPLCQPKKKHK